jgi:hypothetical protein
LEVYVCVHRAFAQSVPSWSDGDVLLMGVDPRHKPASILEEGAFATQRAVD